MRIVRAGVLALVAALVAAAPALASVDSSGGYKFAQKKYTLNAHKTKRLSVSCPRGTHVYGGGQSNPSSYNQVAQLQEYPIDDADRGKTPDDGFEALVKNKSSSSIETTIYASCGKPNATYEVKKETVGAGGFSNEVDTSCSKGKVVGGGVRGPNRIVHSDGGPLDTSSGPVYYAYLNNSGTKESTGKVYAVCAKLHTSYGQVGSQAPSHQQTEEQVDCPPDTVALDGGMGSTGGFSLNGSFPSPGLSYRRWVVFGDNTLNSQGTILALVVCAEHPVAR